MSESIFFLMNCAEFPCIFVLILLIDLCEIRLIQYDKLNGVDNIFLKWNSWCIKYMFVRIVQFFMIKVEEFSWQLNFLGLMPCSWARCPLKVVPNFQ